MTCVQYHPYLDQPCFFVHPCETSRAMADLAAHFVSDETNYLTTWMSIVGGAAGLRLPVGVHSSQPTKLVDAT